MTTTIKSKELVSAADNEKLKFMSGEANITKPRANFPTIKLQQKDIDHAEYGYVLVRRNGEEVVEETLGETFGAVILKIRRRLSGYNEDSQNFYSYEFDKASDHVVLFSQKVPIAKGTSKEIREQKNFVREENVLYVLYNDEVCRMYIKGQSLGGTKDKKIKGFFDFLTTKGDEALASFVTVFSMSEEQTKGKNKWKVMQFKKGGVANAAVVMDKLTELNKYLSFLSDDNSDRIAAALGVTPKPTSPGFSTAATISSSLRKTEKGYEIVSGSPQSGEVRVEDIDWRK